MSASPFDETRFLRENNLTEEQFAETKLEWSCLQDICSQHIETSAALQTAAGYISERLQSVSAVHSLKVRVKDPALARENHPEEVRQARAQFSDNEL